MSVLHLTDLPWEDVLFQHVFPYLSLVELCRLRSVSHECLRMFTEYMRTCISLDFSKSVMSNEVFKKLTSPCTNLRWLSVSKCDWLQDGSLVPMLEKNSRLLYVNLSGCKNLNGASLQALVVNCKMLSTLILCDCPWLTRGGWQVITLHLSNLECIDAEACWDVDEHTILSFLAKFPRLKQVNFSRIDCVSDNVLFHIARHCQLVEAVDVSYCWRITDHGVTELLGYCPNLQGLQIDGCVSVSYYFMTHERVKSSAQSKPDKAVRRLVNPLGLNIQI